jgi:urease accessory protein
MNRFRLGLRLGLGLLAALIPTAALAHVGVHLAAGDTGFLTGFAHPLTGLDHVLAMIAVGLFAAHLGGRAVWLVPLSFVAMMVVAGVPGMFGVGLPLVEVGIGASVVVLGLAVALQLHLPTAAAMALVGLFAVFHGHAHGAEMPENASGLAYGVGFVIATALLHAFGVGLGLLAFRFAEQRGPILVRIGGATMAIAGVAILAGVV